jgi:hypothetical protein
MQLELFNNLSPHQFEGGLECNDCGVVQPVENFQHLPSGEIKRKCKSCKKKQLELVDHLRTLHTYPDENYLCPICQRDIKEIGRKGQPRMQMWVLDHCHDTETFRGWVCSNCNTGLGAFKDDVEKITKAKNYLEDHIRKQKEK